MVLEAPIHQTRLKSVGAMVGTGFCGHSSLGNTTTHWASVFLHGHHQEARLSTTIVTKNKCVSFLEILLLEALVFLDICH
jgi:hypothetical protein